MASHYLRKNGTYCVRVSNGLVGGRQQLVSVTYKPKPGAKKSAVLKDLSDFEKQFEKAVHNGTYLPGMKTHTEDYFFAEMPLGEYINDFYFPEIEEKLSPNTVRFYRQVCEQFIIPSFGKYRLCDITYHNLQNFIDFLAYRTERKDGKQKHGLSPGSVKRYATVFQSVMSHACRSGYLEENPLRHDSVTYPKITQQKLDVYTPDEVKSFCTALRDEPKMTQTLLLTALLLGLRRGEIVALKWDDVDFDRNSVTVRHSAYKLKGEKQALKAPKSLHGNRTVFFPDSYKKILLDWKCEQEEQQKKSKKVDKQDNYVFTNPDGGMISVYTPTRICQKFEEKHGMRHLKLHGLRHTFGSIMIAMGTDPETVRDMMGHDSVKTTDIYLHPYDVNKKKAAERFGSLIEGDKNAADDLTKSG